MWRMNYSVFMNLHRLSKILETMHRMTDRKDLYGEQERYDYVRYITSIMRKTGCVKTEGFGLENLPAEGGYVMCPNHQGKYDAYGIVSVHEKPLTVVMDREMSYFGLVSEIVDTLEGKRMDLKDARQALGIINQVAGEVAAGRRYIIFPEGAYSNSKHNDLWEFKPGCFKAAIRAKAPIVPVVLVDSYKVYNSWQFTPVKTQVHFLEPLYYQDYQGKNTHEISNIVKQRIFDKLTALGKNPKITEKASV